MFCIQLVVKQAFFDRFLDDLSEKKTHQRIMCVLKRERHGL